jgi:antitoxin ParD1/3/4
MPTRNVVLTQHQTELIEKLVDSGRYQNASEVLRDGLRLVESRDAEERARIRALREAVQVGIADLEAGRYRNFDTPGALRRHLSSVADDVLEAHRRSRKRK